MKIVKGMAAGAVALALVVGAASPAAAGKKPPKSCIKALDYAEQSIAIGGEFTNGVASFFTAIGEEAGSGTVNSLMTTLASEAEMLTTQTTSWTARLNVIVPKYKTAAAKCRAGR